MIDVSINQYHIDYYKMIMLIRTISLFLVIIIFREGEGRFVGGLGPLRPGNKKWKINLRGTEYYADNQEQYWCCRNWICRIWSGFAKFQQLFWTTGYQTRFSKWRLAESWNQGSWRWKWVWEVKCKVKRILWIFICTTQHIYVQYF